MKEGIHPKYETVTIRCACGAEVVTKSTAGEVYRYSGSPGEK